MTVMDMQATATQAPQATTRAELTTILEELHEVLLKIDVEEIDRRYVDFEALAKRLQECIEKVTEFPGPEW